MERRPQVALEISDPDDPFRYVSIRGRVVALVEEGAAEYDLRDDQLFAGYEQELFSHVVTVAEKQGKRVELLVVPAVDPFDAMVQTATSLQASRLVAGVSAPTVTSRPIPMTMSTDPTTGKTL